ncbi:MAG: hypothetical protein V4555_07940 [Acidobacteriota bacterium]
MSWKEPLAVAEWSTGVSLHSHTSFSEETLSFIHAMGVRFPGVARLQTHYENLCRERYGVKLDFVRANWRPPLQPKMAWEVESRQIAKTGLYPLVSITDHDTMEGALLLRTLPSSRHIPMSVEWSAPWGQTEFHLGIHNLPSRDCAEWMRRFAAYTAAPNDTVLLEMLRELHESPQVLIVLNHPLWDLHTVGDCLHTSEVLRFLQSAGSCVHALELNGLRHAQENRETGRLARDTGRLLISGGDRHGLEPNAVINLTSATTFTEFVEEIRVERRSHIHFMPQYQQRWEQRIVQSTLAAVTDYPQFLKGWQRWDDRVFHPDANGEMRQLSQLWATGRPPAAVMATIHMTRLFGKRGVAAPLRFVFPRVNDLEVGMEWV